MFLNVPVIMGGMSRQGDRRRVARYVAARRGTLGLSQVQLADKAGVDTKTINNLESGERWPIAKNRSKIEDALGWSDGDLSRVADGDEPFLEGELAAAAGTDAFEAKVKEAIARLPAEERSVVEDLYAELVETEERQERKRRSLERLISVFVHRPKTDGTEGTHGSVATNGDLAEGT